METPKESLQKADGLRITATFVERWKKNPSGSPISTTELRTMYNEVAHCARDHLIRNFGLMTMGIVLLCGFCFCLVWEGVNVA